MKRFFKSIIAIAFPWLILLIHDDLRGAFLALILQATVIGWPFASIWAFRVIRENQEPASKVSNKKN